MSGGLFNLLFDAMRAYNQMGYAIAGMVCLALGGGLIGWFLYGHLTGKRVPGTVASVRVDGYVDEAAAARKSSYPYSGEMYYAVYQYQGPDGTTYLGEDGTGSNGLSDKVPGTTVRLYVNPTHPEKIMRAGLIWVVFGLIFAAPGVLLLDLAFTRFTFNIFTLLIPVALVAQAGFRIRDKLKPHDVRDKMMQVVALVKAARSATGPSAAPPLKGARELTPDEVRIRLAAMRSINGKIAPVVTLFGAGLIVLGIYLGYALAGLLAVGQRAAGVVVRMDSVYSSSGHGSYTYYPVVGFNVPSGGHREFRDKVGSNPPMGSPGDTVTVLYDPAHPAQALIDRGIWNWAASGGCLVGGILLLLIVVKLRGLTESDAVADDRRPAG